MPYIQKSHAYFILRDPTFALVSYILIIYEIQHAPKERKTLS